MVTQIILHRYTLHISANCHSGKFEVKVKQLGDCPKEISFHFKAESQFILTCQKRIRGSFLTAALLQQAKRKGKRQC